MRALLEMYAAEFRTSLSVELQYRASMVIWLLGGVLGPTVYLVVWSSVARGGGTGQVGGYSPGDFAAYFIATMLISHITFTWHMYDFDRRVRHGEFSPLLLRPVHPVHTDIADNLAYKSLSMTVMLPAAAVLALIFHPTWHPTAVDLAALLPALVMAFVMRFLVEWTVALTAFWVTRTAAVNQVYELVLVFLSGQVAPLSLLPAPLPAVAAVLPFRWMVAFPVQLALGRVPPHAIAVGLAAQAAWCLGSLALMHLVWRAGVRRYAAVGA